MRKFLLRLFGITEKAMIEKIDKLETMVYEQQILLKRIDNQCDWHLKNNLSIAYAGFRKIKELANTFPNDN